MIKNIIIFITSVLLIVFFVYGYIMNIRVSQLTESMEYQNNRIGELEILLQECQNRDSVNHLSE